VRGTFWTEAEDARLIELCADSTLSFRDMAEILTGELGKSIARNACIGRAHRLKIERPVSTKFITRAKPYQPRIRMYNGSVKHFKAEEVKTELRVVEVVPLNVSLDERADNGCAYPYGDGPITFCGHPKLPGFSYCAPHKHLCWKPFQDRVRDRRPIWRAA